MEKSFSGLSGAISGANLWDFIFSTSCVIGNWTLDAEATQGLSLINMGETDSGKLGATYNMTPQFSTGLAYTQNYSVISTDSSVALSLIWSFD